jgi:Bifunctional DNA primase/polymerase, N-terminal
MSFFKNIAMPLVERGFHVIPLRPKSKIAIPDNFGLDDPETNMRKRVERWAVEYPDANVAVVAFAGAVCILDDDTGNLESLLPQALPTTMKVKTAKGWHYYFKHSTKSMMLNPLNRKKADVFDFQADRKYVVGPGSIHPSGAVYTLVGDSYAMVEIPDWLVDWINANADIKQAAPKINGKTGYKTKVHETLDFDKLCDWYDFEFVNDGPLYFFAGCPIKGDVHTDHGQPTYSTTALYYDGEHMWFEDQATSCEGYGLTCGGLFDWLHEHGYEKYPDPIWAEEELELPDNLVEDAGSSCPCDEDASINASASEPQAGEASSSASPDTFWNEVKQNILDLRALPGKEMPMWRKKQLIAELVNKALRKRGNIYNVGNIAVWLDKETREITEIVKNGNRYGRLLYDRFGIYSSDKLADDIGLHLGAMAAYDSSKEIYAGSYYDAKHHLLYLNEWEGNILQIDGQGTVTRIKNGDDGLLWNDGEMAQADPLHAELPVPAMSALALNEDSLIKRHILDVINYDDSLGMSKADAQMILMTAIVGLNFIERILAYPMVFFFGPGGSMKTSLATKVGRLLIGSKFRPTPSTTDEDQLKIMAINNSFLLLDEANNLKRLQNVLKSIATGAQDVRRELYTTNSQRVSNYQARIWMTANETHAANETVSARMMIIDTAARTEVEPYRSTFDVNQDWDTGNLRNLIWTELVARLAAAMRALANPGVVKVSHRMSDFFVFFRIIAKAEGLEKEMLTAMEAMGKRQSNASIASNDIVNLLQAVPKNFNGQALEAKEWASIFTTYVVPEASYEMRSKAGSTHWVSAQFQNYKKTLEDTMGMTKGSKLTKSKNRVALYSFTGCEGAATVLPDVESVVFAKDTKEEKPMCECKGCKHCDAKGTDRKCARHSKQKKCSACRSTIPADIIDDMRADAVAKQVSRPADVRATTLGMFDVEEELS